MQPNRGQVDGSPPLLKDWDRWGKNLNGINWKGNEIALKNPRAGPKCLLLKAFLRPGPSLLQLVCRLCCKRMDLIVNERVQNLLLPPSWEDISIFLRTNPLNYHLWNTLGWTPPIPETTFTPTIYNHYLYSTQTMTWKQTFYDLNCFDCHCSFLPDFIDALSHLTGCLYKADSSCIARPPPLASMALHTIEGLSRGWTLESGEMACIQKGASGFFN